VEEMRGQRVFLTGGRDSSVLAGERFLHVNRTLGLGARARCVRATGEVRGEVSRTLANDPA